MTRAKQGDSVSVHYTGKLEDGTVFDSSRDGAPLSFTLGEGQVIPGFDQAVDGMSVGETRTTTIPAEEAYGPYREELVVKVDRRDVPEGLNPFAGQQLELQQPDGASIPVLVTDVDDESITLDANHPLAGEALTFEIELVDVQSKIQIVRG